MKDSETIQKQQEVVKEEFGASSGAILKFGQDAATSFGISALAADTTSAKAHQADIGNSIPTTYFAEAKDVYQEGSIIFPCVKVQEDFAYGAEIAVRVDPAP